MGKQVTEMLKGTLEGIVLAILFGRPAYGYEITAWLREQGFSDIAEGTVYALLIRIEQRGLVDVEKVPSEKGPPRKVYTLNAQGQEHLEEFWRTWSFLTHADRAHAAAGARAAVAVDPARLLDGRLPGDRRLTAATETAGSGGGVRQLGREQRPLSSAGTAIPVGTVIPLLLAPAATRTSRPYSPGRGSPTRPSSVRENCYQNCYQEQ